MFLLLLMCFKRNGEESGERERGREIERSEGKLEKREKII